MRNFFQWLCSSFTYQASLLYTSVATLNLISSSSSIFLLLLSICFPSNHARFTLFKVDIFELQQKNVDKLQALLVGINLSGVMIVSEFATTMTGAVLSQAWFLTSKIRPILQEKQMNKRVSCIPHPLFSLSPFFILSSSGCGLRKVEKKEDGWIVWRHLKRAFSGLRLPLRFVSSLL